MYVAFCVTVLVVLAIDWPGGVEVWGYRKSPNTNQIEHTALCSIHLPSPFLKIILISAPNLSPFSHSSHRGFILESMYLHFLTLKNIVEQFTITCEPKTHKTLVPDHKLEQHLTTYCTIQTSRLHTNIQSCVFAAEDIYKQQKSLRSNLTRDQLV